MAISKKEIRDWVYITGVAELLSDDLEAIRDTLKQYKEISKRVSREGRDTTTIDLLLRETSKRVNAYQRRMRSYRRMIGLIEEGKAGRPTITIDALHCGIPHTRKEVWECEATLKAVFWDELVREVGHITALGLLDQIQLEESRLGSEEEELLRAIEQERAEGITTEWA